MALRRQVLDEDVRGSIGYGELREGLARAVRPPIAISLHDWERLTRADGRGGCGYKEAGFASGDFEERVGPVRFRAILRAELREHAEGLLAAAMASAPPAGFEHATVAAHKLLLIRTESAAAEEAAAAAAKEVEEAEEEAAGAGSAPPEAASPLQLSPPNAKCCGKPGSHDKVS